MNRALSNEDIEAVALRVVAIMSERLAAPRQEACQPLEPERKESPSLPARMTYTRSELCKELNVSTDFLAKLENQGRLMPVPGIWRKIYSKAEVERFLSPGQTKWKAAK